MSEQACDGDPAEQIELQSAVSGTLKSVLAAVREHGWTTVAVEDEPPLVLHGRPPHLADHPELVIVGIPGEFVAPIIERLVARIKDGERIVGDGRVVPGIGRGHGGRAFRVEEQFFDRLGEWYPSGKPYEAIQVVWPDKHGHYPWSLRASRSFRADQPILFRAPHFWEQTDHAGGRSHVSVMHAGRAGRCDTSPPRGSSGRTCRLRGGARPAVHRLRGIPDACRR